MSDSTQTIRIFGEIYGEPEGSSFPNRAELRASGIHRPLQAGISGSVAEGADSIVLSGGYEDDEDYGDVIIYTGHGGRVRNSQVQTFDQTLTRQNLALAISCSEGLPVRVTRGYNHDSEYSPIEGYIYAGLYNVESFRPAIGVSGYLIWRFRLVRINNTELPISQDDSTEDSGSAPRTNTNMQRIIRNTVIGRQIKTLYNYRCQVCNVRLESLAGPYAEAAHIIPLGSPHNGPDTRNNILCLCPNHHVLFDRGSFTINNDYSLNGLNDNLTVSESHHLSVHHLQYNREQWNL